MSYVPSLNEQVSAIASRVNSDRYAAGLAAAERARQTPRKRHSATKRGAGVYLYRGCEIRLDHDSEDYAGWWAVYDGEDGLLCDYFPTKRARR